MQGKGVIKFFLIVMILVAAIQYLFILPTNGVEADAEEYASTMGDKDGAQEEREAYKLALTGYLDSMSSEKVFSIPMIKDYTYQDLKSQQLAFGLDLKGGMSVVLQVDLREFLRGLANDSKDPTSDNAFTNALNLASQQLKNAQADYITLFGDAWNTTKGDGDKLYTIFRRNQGFVSENNLNASSSDGDVLRAIRGQATETVERTFNLLKQRIDKLGVTQPNVSLDAARDLIVVELPGIDNPERARQFLVAAANLEFWKVYRTTDQNPNIVSGLRAANEKLKSLVGSGSTERDILRIDRDTTYTDSTNVEIANIEIDTVYNTIAESTTGPLFDLLDVSTGSFSVFGSAEKNKRKQISEYLTRPEIKSIFHPSVKFVWGRNPIKWNADSDRATDKEEFWLYALNTEGRKAAPLAGDLVTAASASPDPSTGEMAVSLSMNQKGATIWKGLTNEAVADNNREIAIVLDDEVVSAPSVRSAINDGRSSITGNFSAQEAGDLASILEIGKLPAEAKIIQESLVGPSLGAKNISDSITAMVGGFLLVILFMMAYYGGAGVVSIVALFMNLIFIFAALASYGTVLTLPGVAGIILTIGMAVDANVIIYERIREELREGKSTLMAIQDGFSNSYSAIIDANVTTILTAFVLAYFGLGPIKGFAVVLIIGVLSSLFTAVLVGRLLIDWWVSKGNDISFWTGFSKNAFANMKIDWLGKRKVAYAISLGVIVAGLAAMVFKGFDLGVDFKGGYSYNIEFAEGQIPDADALRNGLTSAFDGKTPVVKAVNTENTFNVVTDYLIDSDDDKAADNVMAALHSGVSSITSGDVSLNEFKAPDGKGTHVISSSKVGPTIADDIKESSFYAAVFALLLIFLYIFIRFSKWQYSMGAVAALFHDVLVVMGFFAIFWGVLPFSMEIDQAFIAAILTVIGYSINDTVIVFDRIREFSSTYAGKTKEEIINLAVNSTVSRTVITSLTTLFVILILFLFGGGSIRGFAFALLIGVVVGTYSSIFVATPIMSDLVGEIKQKEVVEKRKSFSRAGSK